MALQMKPTLALDTSSSLLSICISCPDKTVQHESATPQGFTEELALKVSELLREAELEFSDLAKLVVGLGPGSFTGLRVGLSFMKGLSLGLNIPLSGYSSYMAAASEYLNGKTVVGVIGDARREELFCAIYSSSSTGLQEIVAPCIMRPNDFENTIEYRAKESGLEPVITAFEAAKLMRFSTQPAHHIACHLVHLDRDLTTAAGTFSMAQLSNIEPHYVRPVAARTMVERGLTMPLTR